MSAPKDQHLAHLLKEAGLLSADQLTHALEEQRRSGDHIWDILKRDVSKQSVAVSSTLCNVGKCMACRKLV